MTKKKVPNLTLEVRKLLRVLLDAPTAQHYGLELAKAARLADGSIYPILARLERVDWVQSAWEDIDPSKEGRRPRRYYSLTPKGAQVAREAVAEVQQFFGTLQVSEG